MIESLDRRIHPAKVILYKIKNWSCNLIWLKTIYGVNREGGCRDNSHLYRSDCEACNQPIDPKLKKALQEAIKDIKPFWKKAIWITGEDRDE